MSRKRRTEYRKRAFESTGESSDTSANLYGSMLTSPAFLSLTAQQKALYLYCKAQYYGAKSRPDKDNRELFYMNQYMWSERYKLYDKSNAKGFYRDRDALIEKGFIVCVEDGQATRTKSVYAFSSMWQKYGQPGFQVRECDKTASMRKKEAK